MLTSLPTVLRLSIAATLPVEDVLSIASTDRLFASELQQQWLWKLLCKRDWNMEIGAMSDETTGSSAAAEEGAAAAESDTAASSKSSTAAASSEIDDDAADDDQLKAKLSSESAPVCELTRFAGESWSACYRRLCVHFGPTRRCSFQRIEPLWRRLQHWLRVHADELPPILETLPPTFAVPAAVGGSGSSARKPQASSRRSPSYSEASRMIARAQAERLFFQQGLQKSILQTCEERCQQVHSRPGTAAEKNASADLHTFADLAMEPWTQKQANAKSGSKSASGAESLPLELVVDSDLLCALLMHDGQFCGYPRESLFGFAVQEFTTLANGLDPLEVIIRNGVKIAKGVMKHAVEHRFVAVLDGMTKNSNQSANAILADFDQPASLLPISCLAAEGNVRLCVNCGTGEIVRQCADGTWHAVADSFYAFFSRWVSDVESGMYRFDSDCGINRTVLLKHATTTVSSNRGVCIHSCVLLWPEKSSPRTSEYHFIFAQEVSHDGTTDVRAKLVSRYWEIKQEGQEKMRRHGQGDTAVPLQAFCAAQAEANFLALCVCLCSAPPLTNPIAVAPDCDCLWNCGMTLTHFPRRGTIQATFRFRVQDGPREGEEFDVTVKPCTIDADKNYCC